MNKFSDSDYFESSVNHNEKYDAVWNEQHGFAYLLKTNIEIKKFLSLYKKSKAFPQRLDFVASLMEWNQNEWLDGSLKKQNDDFEEDIEDENDNFSNSEDEIEVEISIVKVPSAQLEPYLFYRYPAFIAAKGLFAYLKEQFVLLPTFYKSIDLFDDLLQIQSDIDLAFANFESNEDILAICHLKSIFVSINKLINILNKTYFDHHLVAIKEQEEFLATLFDFREVVWRFLNHCREDMDDFSEDFDS